MIASSSIAAVAQLSKTIFLNHMQRGFGGSPLPCMKHPCQGFHIEDEEILGKAKDMLAALPDRARTPQRLLVASRCMFSCLFCFAAECICLCCMFILIYSSMFFSSRHELH